MDNKRERIEIEGLEFIVPSLKLHFTKAEILQELTQFPERFSANVILRGVFQETILPNIAFIGGGGELAYWLELKKVFEAVHVPYPILVLRNSFLLVNKKHKELIANLYFSYGDIFKREFNLIDELVKRESSNQLSLAKEILELENLYNNVALVAQKTDPTLVGHTEALKTQALKKMKGLEKKMLRAEKRKYAEQQQKIKGLKNQLFPKDSLQERVDNFSIFYANEGKDWLQKIYKASSSFNKGFTVVE